jgi:predicted transcriptional regulator
METNELNTRLLAFFKALSDENRLKIIGLLALNDFSVEKLAETLNLSVSTTSHHLSKLSKSGLVTARPEGHFYFYSLNSDAIRSMSESLLQKETLPGLSEGTSEEAFERKVMAAFTDSEGRIIAFPEKEKKLLVILRYAVSAFEMGKRYSEKEVNETLLRFNKDTAFLRRSFIEYKLMGREGGGREYWRL